jgi:hypothetical protein
MASIRSKVKYVKRAKQTRNHGCHWPGCTIQVPPAVWGCRKHWYMLPPAIRNAIWHAYTPGQEVALNPSEEYIAIAERAQKWIKEYIDGK